MPLSSRCTMPGRSGGQTPSATSSARSGKRDRSPPTRVPSVCPAPGWTTSPAGLSTTTIIGVGVDDLESDARLGRHRAVAGRAEMDGECGALVHELLAVQVGRSVDQHPSGADQLGRARARDVGQHGDGAVEPHAVHQRRDFGVDDIGCGVRVGVGIAGRGVWVVLAVARHCVSLSEVDWATGWGPLLCKGAGGRPKSRQAITMMMPTVTQASARLKVGQ